jgi:hypothetical protein
MAVDFEAYDVAMNTPLSQGSGPAHEELRKNRDLGILRG